MPNVSELIFDEKHLKERWSRIDGDLWSDLKIETLKALKKLLETTMDIELADIVTATPFERSPLRRGWRNGHYLRRLATSLGEIPALEVPRLRNGGFTFKVLPRYQRRAKDINENVLQMFLAGVSTRRIHEVLTPLMGPYALSASTVSRISKVLDAQVSSWHTRRLTDDYAYLILDGVYLKAKSPIRSRRRCVLAVYGIKTNGIRELIDFRLVSQGESQVAWESLLVSLRNRGLEGKFLKLAVVDGNAGLWNALDLVYPDCPRQRCWAHKMRNVAAYVPRKLQKACTSQAHDIYDALNRHHAILAFKAWKRVWNPIAPKAVHCLETDLESLLTFYDEVPKGMWVKCRTTNIIERMFEEVRRRIKTISCFENKNSVDRIIFAIFNRQNQIWERKPLLTSTQFN